MTHTLVIDNYDSFTYNLVDLLTAVNGRRPDVVENDVDFEKIDFGRYDNIVVSPGPGNPENDSDFGICRRVIAESTLPLLGVCLGHQGLAAAYGAKVGHAPEAMHGRLSLVTHDGTDLFGGLPDPLSVVRYHSLAVTDVPDDLVVTAWTDDGVVMALRHRTRPQWGVQFHPESISSTGGHRLLANFRDLSSTKGTVTVADSGNSPSFTSPSFASPPAPRYVVEHTEVARSVDPRAVYDALFAESSHSFWLDGSAEKDPASRFTIMGDASGPLAEYVTYDVTESTVEVARDGLPTEQIRTSFFDYLERQLRTRAVDSGSELPFDFRLGYVGYLGYELKAETGGDMTYPSVDPDAALVFTDRAVVVDHDGGRVFALCLSERAHDLRSSRWLERTRRTLSGLPEVEVEPVRTAPAPISTHPTDHEFTLRHSHQDYLRRIERCLTAIDDGETYEVCLTNEASVPVAIDSLRTFDYMRAVSPVPYAALLQFDSLDVVSTSPERFLRVYPDRTVESKPIKGTRPRGDTAECDAALRHELQSSEKDIAENLMIVDLVRNDLSRSCSPGSVHVPTLFGIETYASVHQMVSTVRGTLAPSNSAIECIRNAFPGGSMTGAPKIRTMQIIDTLEQGPRGIYSGTIGYLSLSGTADLSIVIRTLVSDGTSVRFGIGGAITALSDPEDEFEETLVKASTAQKALTRYDHESEPLARSKRR